MASGKDRIAQAYVELLLEKPAEEIPVKEVIARSGVGRTTYYYHFHRVDEVADYLIEGFADAVRRGVSYTTSDASSEQAIDAARKQKSVDTFSYMKEHQNELVALLGSSLEPRLRLAIRRVVRECFEGFDWYCTTADGTVKKLTPTQRAYYIPQCAAGIYSLIESWADRSFAESPEEISDLSYFFGEVRINGLTFRARKGRVHGNPDEYA